MTRQHLSGVARDRANERILESMLEIFDPLPFVTALTRSRSVKRYDERFIAIWFLAKDDKNEGEKRMPDQFGEVGIKLLLSCYYILQSYSIPKFIN